MNKLSDDRRDDKLLSLFDLYMEDRFGAEGLRIGSMCPFPPGVFMNDTCGKLCGMFFDSGEECPCREFGKDDARLRLEFVLKEEGYID